MTYNTYEKLSTFSEYAKIVRDTSFFSFGKIPTRINNRVVPVGNRNHVNDLGKYSNEIVGVICTPELVESIPRSLGCAVSKNPNEFIFKASRILLERRDYFWREFESEIHETAIIHPTAYISKYNVRIGEGANIGPNAVVEEGTSMGANCFVGPNTTIGTSAYEIVDVEGVARLMPQCGGVRIGDNVTFLSNVTVARCCFPTVTEIGDQCSFDNLVHVGHDSVLGRRVKMTACSMISGRVTLEDDVYVGPNVTVSNGLTVGRQARISLGSVVTKNVQAGATVTGYFAIDHARFLKSMASFRRD